MIKQAIIPLAGLGTRMLPLTSVTPKELLPINGKPNLEYILDECLKAGIKQFIFMPTIGLWVSRLKSCRFNQKKSPLLRKLVNFSLFFYYVVSLVFG